MLTCSGGDSALAADECARLGLRLPLFAPETAERLRDLLPDAATVGNPLDYTALIWGDVERLRDIVVAVGEDPSVDRILVYYDQAGGFGPRRVVGGGARGHPAGGGGVRYTRAGLVHPARAARRGRRLRVHRDRHAGGGGAPNGPRLRRRARRTRAGPRPARRDRNGDTPGACRPRLTGPRERPALAARARGQAAAARRRPCRGGGPARRRRGRCGRLPVGARRSRRGQAERALVAAQGGARRASSWT